MATPMQQDAALSGRANPVIAGSHVFDLGRPVACGGGLPAYAARAVTGSWDDGLMAVQVDPAGPARPGVQQTLAGLSVPNLLLPVAYGPASAGDRVACFVVCGSTAGAAVGTAESAGRRWPETELLGCVLRPAAAALAVLHARQVTHRAIRPNNVFQVRPGQPVVLGAAWAAPPGSLQPDVFEAPASAVCLPAGRGDGTPADDIHALGVLLLALAAGTLPGAGLSPAELLWARLERGNAAVLMAGLAVPVGVAELVAGMVADDPAHRPTAAQLGDPDMVRARRLGVRPMRQAQRPLEVAGRLAWDGQTLAHGLAQQPEQGLRLLRSGVVERWVRRTLVQPDLAGQLEEAARRHVAPGEGNPHAGALHMTHALAALDPSGPVRWQGLAFYPDGLGPALAAATPEVAAVLQGAVEAEAVAAWAQARPEHPQATPLRLAARQHRAILQRRGWAGGLPALRYALNPLAPCCGDAALAHGITQAGDLLPALEAVAQADSRPMLPLDAELAAFLAAREPMRTDRDFADMATAAPAAVALAQLRVLARLQQRTQAGPLPGLAQWLAARLTPLTEAWRGRSRRAAIAEALADRARSGWLEAVLEVLDDAASRTQDEHETAAALAAMQAIDATLAQIASRREESGQRAVRIGHEVAAALGVIAVSVTAIVLALG